MNPNSTSSAGRVTVVGTLNIDHLWQVPALPRPGQTILASAVQQQFGGKGANQAVAAARQGAGVRLIGAVGDDADGRSYRAHLASEGIDGEHIAIVPGAATGTAHVYVDPRGENLIVVDRGANARVAGAALSAGIRGADVCLVQLECELALAVEALRLAAAGGVRCVLNASPTHRAFPWGELAIDTVIVNEHECRECFAHEPVALVGRSALDHRELLAKHGLRHLIVTQGSAPTLHFTADRVMAEPTFRVEPRDTVGAGDTFAGVLAAELAAGRDWAPALRHANVAAALSTLALGAQSAMPRRADVDAAIARAAG